LVFYALHRRLVYGRAISHGTNNPYSLEYGGCRGVAGYPHISISPPYSKEYGRAIKAYSHKEYGGVQIIGNKG
jgi:hypothetical protein